MNPELNKIYVGDCLEVMRAWPDAFVQTVVTSPPYWGLRDYGVPGQIGLEETPEAYIETMVRVFRDVRRVLRDDGTCWINLGDSYAGSGKGQGRDQTYAGPKQATNRGSVGLDPMPIPVGFKPKDQMFMPHRVAQALQADGWYARQTIVWSKPNPMPESVTDRPTTAHEYLFLMAKSERYFYDAEAIKERVTGNAHDRGGGVNPKANIPRGWDTDKGSHGKFHKNGRRKDLPDTQANLGRFRDEQRYRVKKNPSFAAACTHLVDFRNKRSVWTVPSFGFSEAHFATFPPDLIRPCILAGSAGRGIVLDPFMGAGTTALVALQYNRRFLGIELSLPYAEIAERRIASERAQMKMAI